MSVNQKKILEFVNQSYSHPTAEDVFLSLRHECPKISLGTIYRNLNQLADSGQIRRVCVENQPDHFDRVDEHDHLICEICGRVVDIGKIEFKTGNIPDGVYVHMVTAVAKGLCAECAESAKVAEFVHKTAEDVQPC